MTQPDDNAEIDVVQYDQLVDRVTQRTHGSRGDPLTREEVEQVVQATLHELSIITPDET